MRYLFEVSWETCNKVGGIYTVIATKATEAVKEFGDGYIALGPDLGQDHDFQEIHDDVFFNLIKQSLDKANIPCRYGRWKIPASPRVILVGGFKERFNIERLLYAYWNEFGVDSYEGSWDYVEPVIFSTTCAELIEIISKSNLDSSDQVIAHFHEWMSGAGVLYLKKNLPSAGTILTTHATMLGRAMAHHNPYYYNEINKRDISNQAHYYGVQSKHSMESISARNSDCFTTVSEITAREASQILGVEPPLVIYNGMDVKDDIKRDANKLKTRKTELLSICSKFLGEKLNDNTQIWISSGRYEFKNKGYDITLEALSRLKERLKEKCPPILMLFLVAADHQKLTDYELPHSLDDNYREVAISPVYNKDHDPIITATKHYGLDRKNNPVHVVFSSLYLDGKDGIFNLQYEDILEICDLSLFPSFYEPWGYTPLESAVCGIPTITSDLAGFGYWTQVSDEDWSDLIRVITRKNISYDSAANTLSELMEEFLMSKPNKKNILEAANKLRKAIDWSQIYTGYKTAYDIALGKAYERELVSKSMHAKNPFSGSRCHIQPGRSALRCMGIEANLPSKLTKLNDLAYNLWWSWNEDAQELFSSLNEDLWEYFDHNPVRLLKTIPSHDLETLSQDEGFTTKLNSVYERFNKYMGEVSLATIVDSHRPVIAYLSMEFGIHEALTIYSGGLGVLAGDHLKAASDMNQNMVAIGLFYRNGYFVQEINQDGYQIEHYPIQDWKNLPVNLLLNQAGEPVKIPVEFSDGIVWTRVFLARVGRVPLFLLDTDIEENSQENRAISSKLYIGDREARIKQEILIGIASVRLLKDVLGLDPAVYHLNEGHCAFISAELIRRYMLQGFSFESACKAIQNHTVFTTHTPVPAGNEAFAVSLVQRMFSRFFEHMHVSIHQFLDLGRNINNHDEFSMTVLALRISRKANAVSQLHGYVSVEMWQNVFPPEERFFNYVTNGVHVPTWLNPKLKTLCRNNLDQINTASIKDISSDVLWSHHQECKKDLISYLKDHIKKEYLRRGLNIEQIKTMLQLLKENVLLVGFARRFAEYKRANLLFRDIERFKTIISNSDRPVVFVFAGKAHPADERCKYLIQEVFKYGLDPRFMGKVIVVENYNMAMAKLLTSGCDVWLNNPIMMKEACGTSGMKAAINGVLNLSIPDGWWHEGYTPSRGWSIQASNNPNDFEQMCNDESASLYSLLENSVIPTYYNRDAGLYSSDWLSMMKESISELGRDFSAERMLEDYSMKLYSPVIKRNLLQSN